MAVDVKYRISAEDDTRRGLDSAKRELSGFERSAKASADRLAEIGSSMTAAGKKLTIGVTAPLMILGTTMVKSADEQAKAVASLTTAITLAGNQSSVSLERLEAFANEMQGKTLFGDEAQLAAMGILESLTKLDENGLLKVMPHVMDLATAFDMDLQTAAELVAKTLASDTNALSRYGIQVATVGEPTDRLAGLVAELGGKFGGMSEAAAKAGTGPLSVFRNRLSEIGEQFGNIIIPHLVKLAEKLSGVLAWIESLNPKTQEFLVTFGAIAAVAGPGLVFLGSIAKAAPAVVSAVSALSGAFNGLATALGGLVGGGAGGAMAGLIGGPFGLAIAGFAALAPKAAEVAKSIAYWIMDDAMPKLSQFCANVASWFADLAKSIANAVSEMARAIADWVGSKLTAALDKVKSWVEAVGGFFKGLYERVVGHSIIPDLVTEVVAWIDEMAGAVEGRVSEMADNVNGAFGSVTAGSGGSAASDSGGGGSGFAQGVGNALSRLVSYFVDMIAQTEAFSGLMEQMNKILKPLFEQIAVPLVNALRPLVDLVLQILTAIMPAFAGVFSSLGSFIQETMPFWQTLGKVVVATATIFGWLAEKIIAFGKVLYYAVTFQWGKIGGVDWGGSLTSKLDAALAAYGTAMNGVGTSSVSTSATGTTSAGATYSQARQIIVQKGASLITVNTDVIAGDGGFQELAIMMAREIERVEALGLV